MGFTETVLSIPAWIVVILISFLISLLITLIYKWMTDQTEMKSMKDQLKKHQDDMKKHRDDPKKVLDIQKKAMDINMKYLSKSLKPTLITIIPVLIIFAWLAATFAWEPIRPGQEFSTTLEFVKDTNGKVTITAPGLEVIGSSEKEIKDGAVTFKLKGQEGKYTLSYLYGDRPPFENEVVISNTKALTPVSFTKNSVLKKITLSNSPKVIINLGFWKMTWLWVYIISSIVFSLVIRKLMKVY